jgi:hypothetical protein
MMMATSGVGIHARARIEAHPTRAANSNLRGVEQRHAFDPMKMGSAGNLPARAGILPGRFPRLIGAA